MPITVASAPGPAMPGMASGKKAKLPLPPTSAASPVPNSMR